MLGLLPWPFTFSFCTMAPERSYEEDHLPTIHVITLQLSVVLVLDAVLAIDRKIVPSAALIALIYIVNELMSLIWIVLGSSLGLATF